MRKQGLSSALAAAILASPLLVLSRSSSAAQVDAWAQPIPVIDGWITTSKALGDGDFTLFRRYGFLLNDTSQPVPNLFILNCARSGTNHYPYLAVILPKNYPIKSFSRSSWLPELNVRFIIDGKASLGMISEYRDGEVDIDDTPQQSNAFLEVVRATSLVIGFGDKNDVLRFSFDHRAYNALHDLFPKDDGRLGHVTWYSQERAEKTCSLAASPSAAGADSSVRVSLVNVGGTFVAPVVINDAISLNFVVDSGAADVTIPIDVFSTLIRAGTIDENDISGSQTYVTAMGDKSDSLTFKIRSLRLGGVTVHDVSGSVVPAKGTLLLGQSFLRRFKSWSVDNSAHELVLQ
jgi:clan AA aspartic protease (TIGR02281 family)